MIAVFFPLLFNCDYQEFEIGIIKEKAEKEVEQTIKKFKPDMFQVLLSCDVMRGSNCYSTNQLKLY